MPKRSRETYLDDTCKRFKEEVYTTKRKHEEEPQESRKRQRQVTEEYISKLESDNVMMREACMGAGATIETLQNKVKQLEMLLNLQRSQMERIRINSDITVY
jgi:hypothetical protein